MHIHKTHDTYVIEDISRDEMQALMALADFPLWGSQPKPITGVAQQLWTDGMLAAESFAGAVRYGMVPETSVPSLDAL